jgi:hypothetical protein
LACQEGLLGESPFHHALPGTIPPGYIPTPQGGLGVVAPGSATINGRQVGQGFFQYPQPQPGDYYMQQYYNLGAPYPGMVSEIETVLDF